jgi:hypothetical protein
MSRPVNPNQLHVLLIGIDAYDGDGSLRGCVNDVDAIQGVLLDRLGVPPERVTRLVSPRTGATHDTRIAGRLPTLDAIRGELDRLAGTEVEPSDRVLIYFSGHGTQLVLEDARGYRFPREGLLPKDKVRGPQTLVLADWELNEAMGRIGARCLSATIVLDCCNSAGATRAPGLPSGTTRFYPTDDVQPVPAAAAGALSTMRGVAEGLVGRVDNCQVVAACRANGKAKEDDFDGRVMGHLTRSLWEHLMGVDPEDLPALRWGQIWRRVQATVLERNPEQRPWLSTGFGRAVFGGDPDDRGDVGFAVVQNGDRYRLDVGTLADVTEGARVAVYGAVPATFPPLNSREDRMARVGELRIESATRAESTGIAVAPITLPAAARGRLVAPGADVRLAVVVLPHDDDVVAALHPSPFVQVTDDVGHADLVLRRREPGWFLTDDLHGPDPDHPRFPPVPHGRPDIMRSVVEHYYRYRAPLRLAGSCRDLPDLLRLSLLSCDRDLSADEAQTATLPEVGGSNRVRYELVHLDRVCIEIHNDSVHDLHVTLVDVAASGRVAVLGTCEIPARSRERLWNGNRLGSAFEVKLLAGQDIGVDRLVAIGSTVAGMDLGHLRQDTPFAELVRPGRKLRTRDLRSVAARPPVEQYTSATADVWVRRSGLRPAGTT